MLFFLLFIFVLINSLMSFDPNCLKFEVPKIEINNPERNEKKFKEEAKKISSFKSKFFSQKKNEFDLKKTIEEFDSEEINIDINSISNRERVFFKEVKTGIFKLDSNYIKKKIEEENKKFDDLYWGQKCFFTFIKNGEFSGSKKSLKDLEKALKKVNGSFLCEKNKKNYDLFKRRIKEIKKQNKVFLDFKKKFELIYLSDEYFIKIKEENLFFENKENFLKISKKINNEKYKKLSIKSLGEFEALEKEIQNFILRSKFRGSIIFFPGTRINDPIKFIENKKFYLVETWNGEPYFLFSENESKKEIKILICKKKYYKESEDEKFIEKKIKDFYPNNSIEIKFLTNLKNTLNPFEI